MSDRITAVRVPEEALVTGEIAIVSYLDSDGHERWSLAYAGNMLQSHIIGLLEMAKHSTLCE